MLKTVCSFKLLFFCILLTFATIKKHKKKTIRSTAKKYISSKKINGKEQLNRHQYFEKRRNLKAKNWIILFLLILTGINGSLVSFVKYVTYQERASLHKESISEFPAPCEDLSLSADEDFITFDVKKGDLRTFINDAGKYVCSKDNVTETVQTVVERKARFRLAEGVSSDTKLRWDQHSANCHIDPSVYYNDGEVTIPEGRTYFVYATAHFNISRQGENGIKHFGRPRRFSVRICKTVYGYEQTLLGRTVLFNTTKTENVVSSLRIGSHLELSRNDTIYVRVTNANMMIRNSTGNNFGLFPL